MKPRSWWQRQDRARQLGRSRQWPDLWEEILAMPVPQAVEAVQHLKMRRWRPPSDADLQLARVLAGADRQATAQAVDSVFTACTQSLDHRLSSLSPASFAFREPVVALNITGDHPRIPCRVLTVDRNGVRRRLYEGRASHWSMCCLDADTVIARREIGYKRADTEFVEYTPAGEVVLATGLGRLDARVLPTAHGFVLAAKPVPVAFGRADGVQVQLDVTKHGLRRADVFAVDAGGTRIAFADEDRLLVTDSHLRPLHEHVINPGTDVVVHGVGFTPDALIVVDDRARVHRLRVVDDQLSAVDVVRVGPYGRVLDLTAVPAWNLLACKDHHENVSFHDLSSLQGTVVPLFLGQADGVSGPFAVAAHGRFAVFGGHAFPVDMANPEGYHRTVVHDLGHPLNVLAKPLLALRPGDGSADPSYPLSALHQEVLDVVRRAAELRPALSSP